MGSNCLPKQTIFAHIASSCFVHCDWPKHRLVHEANSMVTRGPARYWWEHLYDRASRLLLHRNPQWDCDGTAAGQGDMGSFLWSRNSELQVSETSTAVGWSLTGVKQHTLVCTCRKFYCPRMQRELIFTRFDRWTNRSSRTAKHHWRTAGDDMTPSHFFPFKAFLRVTMGYQVVKRPFW